MAGLGPLKNGPLAAVLCVFWCGLCKIQKTSVAMC